MNKDSKLLAEAYRAIYESTSEDYYDDLSLFLAKHFPHPTLKIGKNLTNPDLGYVDPNQRGIYDQDTGQQVGKLEVTVGDGVITLDNIKAYKQPTAGQEMERSYDETAEQKSYGLGEKVLKHLKDYATRNNLDVQAEIVNPVLRIKFDKIFSDWNVSDEGDVVRASRKNDI